MGKDLDKENAIIIPTVAIDIDKRKKLISFCEGIGFQVELPDVMHLKSFLNEAADKFIIPTKENHFNILFFKLDL